MAIINAFYSKHPRAQRYHTSTKCGPGSEIPKKNKMQGRGGLKHCTECAKLNKESR